MEDALRLEVYARIHDMSSPIFKSTKYLDVRYIPETLQGREHERTLLKKRILRPLARGDVPRNQLLFGPTGSGKTVCVRQILKEIPSNVLKCYLVADMSVYQILKSIAGEFGANITELNIHTNEYWKRVQKAADGRTVCIILDEIDKMLIKNRKNDFSLLYKFSREMDACVIGVTNNLLFEQMIRDDRDRSSFLYDEIIFSPYNATELRDILERRASMAFHEGVLDEEVVPLISAFAASKNGDARYGLDLLSLCGNICEEEDRDHVTEADVRQAQRLADMMLVYRAVNKLTSSQKLLLYAIFTTKDTSPTTIYACYNRLISDGMNGSKLTTKWLSILAQELELLGFVDIFRKGRGRGRGTDFTIQPSGSIDRKYMVDTLTSMIV